MGKPRALIIGITGQDGYYLSKYLSEIGYEVFGCVTNLNSFKTQVFINQFPEISLMQVNVNNLEEILSVLVKVEPIEVYNFAAISFLGTTWTDAISGTETNALGVLKLLEAIRIFTSGNMKEIKFCQASSSEIFGYSIEKYQDENSVIKPVSLYGVAKAYGHQITQSFRENYGAFAVSGILYNHESPRRPPEFVSRKITLGVARIVSGDKAPIRLGNLDARKDWGHASDHVQAMHGMLQANDPSDFVIGTGVAHSVRDLLNVAFNSVGISDWGEYVIHDPNEMRHVETSSLVANASRARNLLNWLPKYSFIDLIKEMVESDLNEIA